MVQFCHSFLSKTMYYVTHSTNLIFCQEDLVCRQYAYEDFVRRFRFVLCFGTIWRGGYTHRAY